MAIDFTLESLLEKCVEALRRDVSYLFAKSSQGRLSPTDSRDLVAYIKLLSELKDVQVEELGQLTDEQLQKVANVTNKPTSGS